MNLNDNISNAFSKNGLSHILAISGMHIGIVNLIFLKLIKKCTKKSKIQKFLLILILLMYWIILEYSSSSTRAVIMCELAIISKFYFRKVNNYISISIAAILILLVNPYSLFESSFLLSFGATLGIFIFYPRIKKIYENKFRIANLKRKINSKIITKLIKYIEESIILTFSVQVFIFPIITIIFKKIPISFIFTSLIVTPIAFLIIVLGIIFLLFPKIIRISSLLVCILEKLIELFIFISKIHLGEIYIVSFPIIIVLIYYSFFFSKIIKRKFIKRILKNLISIFLIIALGSFFFTTFLKDTAEIYLIDVGQGDSTLIITQQNTKILIDGGGDEKYDVGENVLVPYLLAKGIYKLDYVIISHFDTDHVGGILTVAQKLKVENIIIGIQPSSSRNLEKLLELVKKKKINLLIVSKGDKINIDQNTYIDILWPNNQKIIVPNELNNNSIVCKINIFQKSILFTGDIEEIAENEIVEEYKKTNLLKADILKVAHHGSITSSTTIFLNKVKPKIALIGVGENNKFNHPSEEIIRKLQENKCEIYRTDKDGEVELKINKQETKVKK